RLRGAHGAGLRRAESFAGGHGDPSRVPITDARGRLAVDYASTWAERGAEARAAPLLVFGAALVTDLGTPALALSGAGVAAYFALLAAGRLLVPRLGRW